jgi:hypothetical protein
LRQLVHRIKALEACQRDKRACYFEPVQPDDVLSASINRVIALPLFQPKHLLDVLRSKVNDHHTFEGEGIECKMLRPGKEWQKGKLRAKIILEFCSDETTLDNPLDEFRQES